MTMIMNIPLAGIVWILSERLHYIGFPAFISSREGGILSLCPENDGEGGRHEESSGAGARGVPGRRVRGRRDPRRRAGVRPVRTRYGPAATAPSRQIQARAPARPPVGRFPR